jgi:hypothetical protein
MSALVAAAERTAPETGKGLEGDVENQVLRVRTRAIPTAVCHSDRVAGGEVMADKSYLNICTLRRAKPA